MLAFVPAVLLACAIWQPDQAAWLTVFVAVAAIAIFLTGYEKSQPGLRQIMPAVVLGAFAAAGRILFALIPDFKPVAAIAIMAGAIFGQHCGFMVGALAALTSNAFFGQGAWTPWQMYAWGLVGYLGGLGKTGHAQEAFGARRLRLCLMPAVRGDTRHVEPRELCASHNLADAVDQLPLGPAAHSCARLCDSCVFKADLGSLESQAPSHPHKVQPDALSAPHTLWLPDMLIDSQMRILS